MRKRLCKWRTPATRIISSLWILYFNDFGTTVSLKLSESTPSLLEFAFISLIVEAVTVQYGPARTRVRSHTLRLAHRLSSGDTVFQIMVSLVQLTSIFAQVAESGTSMAECGESSRSAATREASNLRVHSNYKKCISTSPPGSHNSKIAM